METTGCGWKAMPDLMPGPIWVKFSGVAGVWWESDLGKKIFFFVTLKFFHFIRTFFFVLATKPLISACGTTLLALRTVALRHIYFIYLYLYIIYDYAYLKISLPYDT